MWYPVFKVRLSVVPDYRRVGFSVIPDFRPVRISVTVPPSRKLGKRTFRNRPVPSRPVPSRKLGTSILQQLVTRMTRKQVLVQHNISTTLVSVHIQSTTPPTTIIFSLRMATSAWHRAVGMIPMASQESVVSL